MPHSGSSIDSIAVLPFTNVTADPNSEYLSDGLTDSLIGSLSQLPNLSVRPRSTVFRYRGKDIDLQKAEAQASEAQIEAALEKVRAKAMTMHNSNDLSITASIVFT